MASLAFPLYPLSRPDSAMRSALAAKYAFLYAPSERYLDACVPRFQQVQVYVIYKVDAGTGSRHNYPPLRDDTENGFSVGVNANSTLSTDNNSISLNNPTSAAPFRTVSHYGYNCPLACAPNILLHPEHLSIWQSVAEQRERVVSFFDLTALNFAKRKMLSVLSGGGGCGSGSKSTAPAALELSLEEEPTSPSYVSEMHIKLEPTSERKRRTHSAMTSSSSLESSGQQSAADDDLDGLIEQFGSMLSISERPIERSRPTPIATDHGDDDSLYPSNYTMRSFLPDNHEPRMDKDEQTTTHDRPEAEQAMYEDQQQQAGDDSGLGDSGAGTTRRRERLVTSSNDSSTQEAEAYSQGKHIRLTLSSSPDIHAQLKTSSIEILINVSLRNSECVQTVQAHEQEFRSKLEKVIDDEIHYISQQLAMQQRSAQLLQSSERDPPPRAPLATPTSSSTTSSHLLQRCNSAPALCHTYSYVALPHDSELLTQAPMRPQPSTEMANLELELQRLLNSLIHAHELHHRAVIYDCRMRISQMRDDLRGAGKKTRAK